MLAKGRKRKRSEDEAGPSTPVPSSSMFNLSLSKLHQSLQHVEPNLRHLVLVANTLRRIQDEMQPATAPGSQLDSPAGGGPGASNSPVDPWACTAPDACRKPLPVPSLVPQMDELLLSNMDVSVFSTLLEDLSAMEDFEDSVHLSVTQPEGGQLCLLGPESERTSHSCPSGPQGPEIPGPGTYLLEDGLEGLFEDIDTSMYDCDLWSPTSLPSLKEAFSSAEEEEERPGLADLDYLVDMLVGGQEL